MIIEANFYLQTTKIITNAPFARLVKPTEIVTNAPFVTTTTKQKTTTTPFVHEDVTFDGSTYYHVKSDVFPLESLKR